MLQAGHEFLLSTNRDSTSILLSTDFNGKITDTLVIFDSWRRTGVISEQNNMLAIAGSTGSGPDLAAQAWLPYNALHIWLHTRPLSGPALADNISDAALVGVQQSGPVVPSPIIGSWTQDTLYHLSGGPFSVAVKNSGETPLNSVDVCIGFEWVEEFICFYRPVKRRQFTNLNLEPGATVWLDFGAVMAGYQPDVPAQFCFWTSVPNERPDANHEDDVYCHSISVSAEEIKLPAFSITPNPSHDGCWISGWSTQKEGTLFDLAGRLIERFDLPDGQHRLFLETAALPAGLYWFRLGNFAQKLAVLHP